jgi:hypothetical protein
MNKTRSADDFQEMMRRYAATAKTDVLFDVVAARFPHIVPQTFLCKLEPDDITMPK